MKNRAEAMEISNREAVLFGEKGGIPLYKVLELVGKDAVDYVLNRFRDDTKSAFINGYGIGDYTATYLTVAGWLTACTFLNVQEISKLDVQD